MSGGSNGSRRAVSWPPLGSYLAVYGQFLVAVVKMAARLAVPVMLPVHRVQILFSWVGIHGRDPLLKPQLPPSAVESQERHGVAADLSHQVNPLDGLACYLWAPWNSIGTATAVGATRLASTSASPRMDGTSLAAVAAALSGSDT